MTYFSPYNCMKFVKLSWKINLCYIGPAPLMKSLQSNTLSQRNSAFLRTLYCHPLTEEAVKWRKYALVNFDLLELDLFELKPS